MSCLDRQKQLFRSVLKQKKITSPHAIAVCFISQTVTVHLTFKGGVQTVIAFKIAKRTAKCEIKFEIVRYKVAIIKMKTENRKIKTIIVSRYYTNI